MSPEMPAPTELRHWMCKWQEEDAHQRVGGQPALSSHFYQTSKHPLFFAKTSVTSVTGSEVSRESTVSSGLMHTAHGMQEGSEELRWKTLISTWHKWNHGQDTPRPLVPPGTGTAGLPIRSDRFILQSSEIYFLRQTWCGPGCSPDCLSCPDKLCALKSIVIHCHLLECFLWVEKGVDHFYSLICIHHWVRKLSCCAHTSTPSADQVFTSLVGKLMSCCCWSCISLPSPTAPATRCPALWCNAIQRHTLPSTRSIWRHMYRRINHKTK